jgi:DNA-binding CsgD family transcriptional regulator/PAS domain-containing protein
MTEPPPDLSDLAYDAAAGELPWAEFGRRLRAAFGARTGAFWIADAANQGVDMLSAPEVPDDLTAAYVRYYHRLDPWVRPAAPGAGGMARAWLGPELLPDAVFHRTEFYADFASRVGFHHLLGAVVDLGGGAIMPLGLHRPHADAAFTEADRRALQGLLPHLRRAGQIRRRLMEAEAAARTGFAALDALALGVVIATAEARVMFANRSAERLAAATGAFALVAEAGPRMGSRLRAAHRAEAARLDATIIAVAARGAAGATVPLHGIAGGPPVAAVVMPLPARLAEGRSAGIGMARGMALVLLRDLACAAPPDGTALADLFGLTRAEAAVTRALAGGVTAEAAALTLGLSPATVRNHLRAVLEKTGAASLRDLERVLASMPGVG